MISLTSSDQEIPFECIYHCLLNVFVNWLKYLHREWVVSLGITLGTIVDAMAGDRLFSCDSLKTLEDSVHGVHSLAFQEPYS